jgi:hypothetical protein
VCDLHSVQQQLSRRLGHVRAGLVGFVSIRISCIHTTHSYSKISAGTSKYSALFTPGKGPRYPLDRRLGGPQRVQTGSGAHPASYPMGTGGQFPGGKARPGRDADHSPHLVPRLSTGCPKKMYTHKVNIPYYNVHTSFWDTLYE